MTCISTFGDHDVKEEVVHFKPDVLTFVQYFIQMEDEWWGVGKERPWDANRRNRMETAILTFHIPIRENQVEIEQLVRKEEAERSDAAKLLCVLLNHSSKHVNKNR